MSRKTDRRRELRGERRATGLCLECSAPTPATRACDSCRARIKARQEANRANPPANVSPQDLSTLTAKQVEGFWSKVDKSAGPDACWPWTAGVSWNGYGKIAFGGAALGQKHYRAHRVSLFFATGVEDGLALHSCDNPACVNPAHLRWGTGIDNSADMKERGRECRGEKQWQSKLTAVAVREIRQRFTGDNRNELAAEFNINQRHLWLVATRRAWRHIP